MTNVNDAVVERVTDRGRNLLLTEAVGLIERHHPSDARGLGRETLRAYAEAFAEEPNFGFAPEKFVESVDDALVGVETYVGDDALYDLGDDRISVYPRAWHDRLGGETDIREYVAYLESDESGFADNSPRGGRGDGIDQPTLLDVVAVLSDLDRNAARAQIEERRANGQIRQPADQHPDARVQIDRSSS